MTTPSPHRLAEVPLFAGLPAAALDAVAQASRVRRYPAGQVLWNEGDPGDALLVLEAGHLRISRFAPSGAVGAADQLHRSPVCDRGTVDREAC